LLVTDDEGNTTQANSRCARYFGVADDELRGGRWHEFVHPEEKDKASSASANAVGQQTVLEGEYRLRRADGSYVWHTVRMVPVRDSEGRSTSWIWSGSDIDDQKLAAEELRRKEERLRIALEASDTGTFRWNPRTGEFLEFGP